MYSGHGTEDASHRFSLFSGGFHPQVFGAEALRQELIQGEGFIVCCIFGHDDLKTGAAEFAQGLAAETTGRGIIIGFIGESADNTDGGKAVNPLADGLGDGGALRADRGSIGGVLDIAAREYTSVCRQEGGPDAIS